ncbi:MAG: hypothetical protein IPJ65_10610 [Archangiaceae bacterium]|nr:hypothetical protein [Archangiaceae bacterium]
MCPSGTTCAPSSQTCQAASLCAQVTCIGGTTCDPVDGLCRCGGQGGPVCTAAQLCNVGPPPTCQGGPACTGADGGQTLCTGGTSCDPSDGRCRCGGLGGVVCQGGEVCVSSALSMACRAPCDPLSPACSTGTWCFFDGAASPPTAYCAPPSNVRAEGQACVSATSCFQSSPAHALVCVGLAPGQAGICREYCATSSGTTGCSQVPATQLCTQLPQAASGLGYCAP